MSRPSFDKQSDPLVGTTIAGRYRVDAIIDQGAMGRVYSGTHIAMRKRVAIKVLRPELTRVPEVMERFAREARAAAHINHPHVAGATDFGELSTGAVFLVLEFVEGITLRSVIEHGPLPLRRVLSIVRQIASALQAANALSIVHRDLKPENVMLVKSETGEDFIKVLDFGVAKVPIDFTGNPETPSGKSTQITKAGMVFGTPDYMAVEQALGQDVDGRADLYSLGVIAYELITGRRPFRCNHEFGVIGQQLTGKAPAMSRRAPWVSVPENVEQMVMRLLETDVNKRTASATELLEQVTAVAQSLPEDWPDPPVPTAEQLDAADQEYTETELEAGRVAAGRGSSAGRSGLGRWHAQLPEPLSLVPLWVYVSVAVLFVLGGFGIVLGFVLQGRGTDDAEQRALAAKERGFAMGAQPGVATATAPSAAVPGEAPLPAPKPALSPELAAMTEPQRARMAELDSAKKAGDLALAALLARYPTDGWLRVQLARTFIPGSNTLIDSPPTPNAKEALKYVAEGVRMDPALIGNKYVAGVLWYTAQHRDTRDATFKLLSEDMLAAGADIIYDLATTDGVPTPVADNAKRWLTTPDFRAAASVEARVASELVTATTCEELSAAVSHVIEGGDERGVSYLRSPQLSKLCADGTGDCAICANGAQALKAAADKLHARLKATKPADDK